MMLIMTSTSSACAKACSRLHISQSMMAYSSTGIARAVEIAKEKLALKFQR